MSVDKRKQAVYLPEDVLEEIYAESRRQGRSLSWLIQHAWKAAKPTIERFPGLPEGVMPDGRSKRLGQKVERKAEPAEPRASKPSTDNAASNWARGRFGV